jgi:hypothetical protein
MLDIVETLYLHFTYIKLSFSHRNVVQDYEVQQAVK